MAVFIHRNTLRDADLEGLPDQTQRIVRAAFRVAEKAHAGQSRGKIDPSIQYISHPLMVYDLLRRAKIDDPVMLAGALLHDSLEDCPRYAEDHERMFQDLFGALQEEGVHQQGIIRTADKVLTLCEQMTNPQNYPIHKLAYQVDRVRQMPNVNARILKMADQMASLICHLTLPEDEAVMPHAKVKKFGDKAVVLIHAVLDSVQNDPMLQQVQSRMQMYPWRILMSRLEPHYCNLLLAETPEAEETARAAFAADTLDGPVRLARRPGHYQLTALSEAYEKDEKGVGITRIEYGRLRNDVVGFDCWVAEGEGPNHPRNRIERQLCEAIQQDRRDIEVHLRAGAKRVVLTTVDAQGKQCEHLEAKHYRLSKPMPRARFMELAFQSGALTECEQEEAHAQQTGRGAAR